MFILFILSECEMVGLASRLVQITLTFILHLARKDFNVNVDVPTF